MFWRMTGLSSASPVETILNKENYTLEELLDEDEIIQECKASNNRLINYLRDRAQVEQLLRYIVEEAPEDAEKKRIKFSFIACEIFTCEVDIILKTLVVDQELMNLLFSFLKPNRPHSASLAGYFSKVVMCLYLRKTVHLMNYVKGHWEILRQLVDLIGITSIMEVLIQFIGADDNMSSNYVDTTQWLKDTELLDMIVDKFSSSDSPEVHANAAEILCAIIRCAPPGFAPRICSPSFVGRLLRHALEESRPKSVLVNSLTVCMSLLDPKRLVSASYSLFRSQLTHGSLVAANAETIDGMLKTLGDLLKLLDVSTAAENILPTTYGALKPPFGKHRLKIVEFISVLLTIGSEAAEKELVQQGAIKHVLDLFFEYPFNNFLHHYVESIIRSCLDSKRTLLVEHVIQDCDIIDKIAGTEKQALSLTDCTKPTTIAQGRAPPRIGNIGHTTRIANKLVELGNNNSIIHTHLQKNNEWAVWHANVLLKRNAIENVHQWVCGRPNALQDRFRDSDEEDFHNRDYDVAALANNLSQVFQYGNYSNVDNPEADAPPEREDEDAYFDDESAEVVVSSLCLGDDQDSTSLFTNSNWFAYEEDRSNDRPVDSFSSPSTSTDHRDEIIAGGKEGLVSSASSNQEESERTQILENGSERAQILENGSAEESQELGRTSPCNNDEKPPQWVEWRETSDSSKVPESDPPAASLKCELERVKGQQSLNETSVGTDSEEAEGGSPGSKIMDASVPSKSENEKQCTDSSHEPEPSDTEVNTKVSHNEDGEPEPSNTDINTKISGNEDGEHEPSNTDINTKISGNEDGEHEPSNTDIHAKVSENEDCEPEPSNTDVNTKISGNEDGEPEPSNTDVNAKVSENEDCEPEPSNRHTC